MGTMESVMYNHCTFIGNLGKDPEARASQTGGSFTTFSIAVSKRSATRDDKPLWVNVTAFGKTGEAVAKNLHKGSRVLVEGALELQEYEGSDGKNHSSLKLLANNVTFLDKKETNGNGNGAAPVAVAAGSKDEDIPF